MKSKEAAILIKQIEQAITDIDSLNNISELEKSYLAKFLIVFICGIYEEVIETIVNERIDAYGHSEISKYVKNSVHKNFRNPSIEKIKELLGNFEDSWKAQIVALPQNVQFALDNIVNDKNSLAHGNVVNITLEDVKQYYSDSMIAIYAIDDMLL